MSPSTDAASDMAPTDDNGYPTSVLGFTAACVFLIGLVGTFGNILAAMALLYSPKLRQKPSTAFMVNLPACLIPVCAIGMPMFGASCIQQIYYGKVLLPKSICVAAFTVGLILSQVHIHTISALAFNRLVAVMWPSTYKKLMRPRVVAIYLISIWIYSALLWLPIASGLIGYLDYEPEELMVSMVDKSISRSRKGMHVFMTYLLPILFTSFCYLFMYIKVRRIRQVTRERSVCVVASKETNVIRQWEDHVTKTILVIYTILISCSVPHLIIHILHLYTNKKEVWLLLHIIFWLQFCLDPIVYVGISRVYRRATMECLARLFPRFGFFQVPDGFPKSDLRSDNKNLNLISSPTCTKHLRPPVPQKIEFSSEVHRDLLDPKNIMDKS